MDDTEAIFALMRRATAQGDSQRLELEAAQWWRLFRVAQQNHVAALTASAMAEHDVPREVKIPWIAETDKAIRWQRYQADVQADIIGHMRQHGISTLVLKGLRTARHYPHPELREFGDLDLYFYDRHHEADEVARKELHVAIANDAHHHTKYDYRGVTVESHYNLLNIHYPPSNRRFEALLTGLLAEESDRATARATFEVLFLLRHMAVHFAAGRMTLRDLADWALTTHALREQADWDRVREALRHHGMERFANILGRVAARRLGMTLPIAGCGADETEVSLVEHDMVLGSREANDSPSNGPARLPWKLRRWRANAWKRRLTLGDSESALVAASLTAHVAKPRSILNKM